ncbi:MAG: hypothetical protein U1E63_15975 [Burkholderiales bacterium]
MGTSLDKLSAAQDAVAGNPELETVDVVRVHERSGDYILRDYDPSSQPLSKSPAGQGSRQAAIDAILGRSSRSATEQDILSKLQEPVG